MTYPCVGHAELFMDDDDGSGPETTGYTFPFETEAKALCASCPFIKTCLAEHRDSDMIVGGTTPKERRKK